MRTVRKPRGPALPRIPEHFSHFIMNLPYSAMEFLPAFIGAYRPHLKLFETMIRSLGPTGKRDKMPMIHVYCFSVKVMDDAERVLELCAEVNRQLQLEEGDLAQRLSPTMPDFSVHKVRDVAPNKSMFCVSFRLPWDVAFRDTTFSNSVRIRGV